MYMFIIIYKDECSYVLQNICLMECDACMNVCGCFNETIIDASLPQFTPCNLTATNKRS